jgi:hypothetical protein
MRMTRTGTPTEDFTAVLHLTARPETVAALFTSAAGVSRWWGPTEGDGAVGGTLIASFGDNGVNAMRVVEARPSRVVWEPVAVPGRPWHRTAVPARRPDPAAGVLERLLRRLDLLPGEHRDPGEHRHRHAVRGLRAWL